MDAAEYPGSAATCQDEDDATASSSATDRARSSAGRFPFRSYSRAASSSATSASSRRPARARTSARSKSASACVFRRSVRSPSCHRFPRQRLGSIEVSLLGPDPRAGGPPEHLGEDVVRGGRLLAGTAEAGRLLVPALRAEGLREEAGDRRAEGTLAHSVQGCVTAAKHRHRGLRRSGEALDQERLLRCVRSPDVEAEVAEGAGAVREQFPREIEFASHRLEHRTLDAAPRFDRRIVAGELLKLLRAGDALDRGKRAEDRAEQQPADALRLLRRIARRARRRRAPASRRARPPPSRRAPLLERGRAGSTPGPG